MTRVVLKSAEVKSIPPLLEEIYTIYSSDLIASGAYTPEEAYAKARADIETHLPGGMPSSDEHKIMHIVHIQTGTIIGSLWYCVKDKEAYIHWLSICESERHKGYATEALNELEKKLLKLQIHRIGLHVFEHNVIAKKLYDNFGYTFLKANEVDGKRIGKILEKNL
jgi:RimJ/RimL family protein N-acetyltransferase